MPLGSGLSASSAGCARVAGPQLHEGGAGGARARGRAADTSQQTCITVEAPSPTSMRSAGRKGGPQGARGTPPLMGGVGFAPTGWSGIGPVCGPFGQVDGPRVSPAHPHRLSTPLTPAPCAQTRLPLGLRGACEQKGGIITRRPFTPNSPLPSLHTTPTLQISRRPPASPTPSEPGLGSLTPVCGPSRRVCSRRFFRALAAAPMLQTAAVLGWSWGRSEGRCRVDAGTALCMWPMGSRGKKWRTSGGRGAVARRASSPSFVLECFPNIVDGC